MEYERIHVECYSGYKSNEYPSAFSFHNHRWKITEIIDRWYEGGIDSSRPALYYYKGKTAEGKIFLLRYDPLFDAWYLMFPFK